MILRFMFYIPVFLLSSFMHDYFCRKRVTDASFVKRLQLKIQINKPSCLTSGLIHFWKVVVSSQFALGERYESERFHKRPDGRRQRSAGVVSGHVSAGKPAVRAER